MPVAINVVLHDTNEDPTWPDSVTNLLSRLTQPLPKSPSSDAVQAALSPGAKEMYIEAVGSPGFVLIEEDDSSFVTVERIGRPVTDVVDTVLSSVRMVKASNAISDSRGCQQARRSWTSLIAALGVAIQEDVHILGENSFLKARTQRTRQVWEARDVEGVAAVLLSCIQPLRVEASEDDGENERSGEHESDTGSEEDAGGEEDADDAPSEGDGSSERNGENEGDIGSEEDAGREDHAPPEDDGSTEENGENESDTGSEDDTESEDEPQMTDDEDKFFWDSDVESEPNMSHVFLSSDNSDASSSSGPGQHIIPLSPNAHILTGHGTRVDCILPVVCAADESEIEALVTSVVCQRHVWSIETPVVGFSLSKVGNTATLVVGWMVAEEGSAAPTVHLLYSHEEGVTNPCNGQFDLVDPASALRFAQFILDLQPYFSSIKKALQSLQTQDFCWRLDLIDFEDNPVCWIEREDRIKGWIDDIAKPPGVATSEAMPSRNEDKANLDAPPGMAQSVKIPSSHISSSSELTFEAKSHYTASAFAELAPPNIPNNVVNNKPGADKFRWERRTLSIPWIPIPDPSTDIEEQINEMFDYYEEVTAFRWPASWTTADSVTRCDDVYDHLRSRLFEDFQADTLDQDSEQPKLMADEDETFQSISNHMSIFLKAIASAVVSKEQVSVNGATESAMRGAWDDLLKALCSPPEQALSETYFVERTIFLPKNQAVEEGPNFQAQQQADLFEHLLVQQCKNRNISTDTKLLGHTLLKGALDYFIQVRCAGKDYFVKAEERAYEPSEATVDGVYCLEYILEKPVTQPPADAPSRLSSKHGTPKCEKTEENAGKDQSAAADDGRNDTHARRFTCPAMTHNLPSGLSIFPELTADSTRIYLPFMFVQYRRDTATLHQAFHKVQIYCISGIEYLASMGIADFPVWGIVTTGTEVGIVMAWKSTRSATRRPKSGSSSGTESSPNYNILIDTNMQTFDLTKPLRAIHFATCVHEIYKLQEDLKARADKIDFARLLNDPFCQNWKMSPVGSQLLPSSSEEPTHSKEPNLQQETKPPNLA